MEDPESVALKIGVTPETGFRFASLKVIEINETATPLATTGVVPMMSEFAAAGEPGEKVTTPSAFVTGVTMDKVLASALVEERVHVETPEALVAEHAP